MDLIDDELKAVLDAADLVRAAGKVAEEADEANRDPALVEFFVACGKLEDAVATWTEG
jgi:hypothetical protein